MVVFGQRGIIRARWLYSGKSCCILSKVVVFGQSGCIRANVAVFVQSCCTWVKVIVFGQSVCIRPKLFFMGKMVVFGQKWLYSSKYGCNRVIVVVFGQKLL